MSLDEIRETVDVLCLENGHTYTYVKKSVRDALVLSGLQIGMGDYNSWDYARKMEEWRGQVKMGPSGKTANFALGGRTFSAILDQ